MSIIRWLHISDLHLNTDEVDSVRMRENLPKFFADNNIRYDYVFCTGDIRDSSGECYKEPFPNSEFLTDLCKIWNLPVENLFIVPGNHDVNRLAANRTDVVEKMLWKDKSTWNKNYKPEIGNIDKGTLYALHEGQAGFRKFLGSIYGEERLKKYQDAEHPHFVIETEWFNVLHVDSTLSYSAIQTDNLIIGSKQLQWALKGINNNKPTILITHYAMELLESDERKQIANMLRDYSISLWLAGHEHNHELKPYGYMDSIQAGELKIEQRCSSTVLVGEYDTELGQGFIKAYTWFSPSGWAEHPLIWRGFSDESCVEKNKYPFKLTTCINEGRSYEVIRAEKANSAYNDRVPDSVLDIFFADINCDNQIYTTGNPLVLLLENKNYIELLGDGGMGKTTMMIDACRKLTKASKIALYIQLEQVEAFDSDIETTIAQSVYQGHKDKITYANLILFLDGMNEITSEQKLTTEIRKLSKYDGIKIVISSRTHFAARYGMDNKFIEAVLQPLRGAVRCVF
jgi:predicted MPP superfamily phosphohydrolase